MKAHSFPSSGRTRKYDEGNCWQKNIHGFSVTLEQTSEIVVLAVQSTRNNEKFGLATYWEAFTIPFILYLVLETKIPGDKAKEK